MWKLKRELNVENTKTLNKTVPPLNKMHAKEKEGTLYNNQPIKTHYFSSNHGNICELQEMRQFFHLKFKSQNNILLDTKYFLMQENIVINKLTFVGVQGLTNIVSSSSPVNHKIVEVKSGKEIGKTITSTPFGKKSWIVNVTSNDDVTELLSLNMKFIM